ncbi:Protein of uncharacterised function%2C DUF [Yersinia frederiksenii]|uniref:CopG protein n=1 Tax=Yersinia intermedia TaxID=631 RepID=A0A208ZV56_YERIN|nr:MULTISPECIES: DUF411 domain-containing protein [Yersiniaceae]EKN4831415.1 hypothetical protein [Yersinia enterocolitica]EKN4853527.1 hypothetical protein [Yersinia enterocolitica]ELI8280434.1 hypothetical protein [Yersinia enterocolitica]ELW8178199.1 hypothetical protein [Yersinia enterocolitica]MBB1580450.1 hypothetical protein [Serratia sp. OS31]
MKKVLLMTIMLASSLSAFAGEKIIDLYKSENCGCCTQWGQVMEKQGYQVNTHVMNESALATLKDKYAIPTDLRSCHVAITGNLIIEGHVPAEAISKALVPGSGIYGLATPGMPAGSPGMEMGDKKDPYNVIAFDKNGSQRVFQRIE